MKSIFLSDEKDVRMLEALKKEMTRKERHVLARLARCQAMQNDLEPLSMIQVPIKNDLADYTAFPPINSPFWPVLIGSILEYVGRRDVVYNLLQ